MYESLGKVWQPKKEETNKKSLKKEVLKLIQTSELTNAESTVFLQKLTSQFGEKYPHI